MTTRVIAFWVKMGAIFAAVSLAFVFFDFQIVPMVKRSVRDMKHARQETLAKAPLPAEVPFRKWTGPTVAKAVAEPASGRAPLFITSIPEGATVMMNEKMVGVTPFEAALPLHTETRIALSREGYFPESRTVTAENEKALRFVFPLRGLEDTDRLHMKTTEPPVVDSTDALVMDDLKSEIGPDTLAEEPPPETPAPPKVSRQLPTTIKQELKKTQAAARQDLSLASDTFFTVQVDSLKEVKEATYKAALLQAMGYQAYVCSVDMEDKGKYFRVRIGEFGNRKQAEALAHKIKGDVTSTPWILREEGLCPKLVSATPWDMP